ncbi:hypothetical protein WA026_012873, partial [Henosepilachna vigintioctopunctata]
LVLCEVTWGLSVLGSVEAQEKAEKWFTSNKLLLNISKTERIVFSSGDMRKTNKGACGVRFLGVRIDSGIQWDAHVVGVASSLNRGLYLLCFLANNVSPMVLRAAYRALVVSYNIIKYLM